MDFRQHVAVAAIELDLSDLVDFHHCGNAIPTSPPLTSDFFVPLERYAFSLRLAVRRTLALSEPALAAGRHWPPGHLPGLARVASALLGRCADFPGHRGEHEEAPVE